VGKAAVTGIALFKHRVIPCAYRLQGVDSVKRRARPGNFFPTPRPGSPTDPYAKPLGESWAFQWPCSVRSR
jgi:hypothetical protein